MFVAHLGIGEATPGGTLCVQDDAERSRQSLSNLEWPMLIPGLKRLSEPIPQHSVTDLPKSGHAPVRTRCDAK